MNFHLDHSMSSKSNPLLFFLSRIGWPIQKPDRTRVDELQGGSSAGEMMRVGLLTLLGLLSVFRASADGLVSVSCAPIDAGSSSALFVDDLRKEDCPSKFPEEFEGLWNALAAEKRNVGPGGFKDGLARVVMRRENTEILIDGNFNVVVSSAGETSAFNVGESTTLGRRLIHVFGIKAMNYKLAK